MITGSWSLDDFLPSEPPASKKATIAISLLDAPPCEPSSSDWIHQWSGEFEDMRIALSGKGGSFFLRFASLADFVISRDGHHIEAWPDLTTDIETLSHLLLDQVLPRVLAQRGRLVLHAGAVQVGVRAIAFMGSSGSGKSTLTASLHAAGYPLLSDDSLVLIPGDRFIPALATYPSLRLWPEAVSGLYAKPPALTPVAYYNKKQRVMVTHMAADANNPLALAAICILEPKDKATANVSLTRLKQQEACMKIIGNSFQLDLTDRRRVADAFAHACRISERLPVFSLAYPRDFVRLPEVHAVILNQLSERATGKQKCVQV
jgi:hypothetical protein